MDSQDFVDSIKEAVRDAAIADTLSVLENPVGRKTIQETRDMAEWYKSLDENQKRLLLKIITKSVDLSVFGILCVIDGSRSIEDRSTGGSSGGRGVFELNYVKDGQSVTLNANASLHELYNAR
jgi:hypothetical protein